MNCPNCHQSFDKPTGGQVPYTCPHCQSKVLGVYCDLTHIGGGAMGDVFRGLRPDMGRRTVAIKLPKAAEARVCGRFEREIAASARLRHENIVCAFDRGEEQGRPYLVMEYVAGRVLSDLVDAEHPLSPAEAARYLRQVAAGLQHAAQQKIVNRDIKPDNVLITAEGTAKILDYGLALIAELDGSSDRVTRNGTLLGTPGFLAPEQALDPSGVSIAADVYSLGCTAHYVLTRRPPFTGKNSFAILRQHAEAPRPSVREKRPDVDAAFDSLIQRMMAVDPDQRPTPRDLVQQLDRMIPSLNAARPSLAGPASGMIDTRCPGCQEVYHLRSDMVRKRMQCRNKLCGQKFMVEPQVGETELYAARPPIAAGATLQVTRDGMAAAFEANSLEALDAAIADAEIYDAEAVDAEAVEAEAVEAEEAEAFAGEPPPQFGATPPEPEIAEAEVAEAEVAEAEVAEAEVAEADVAEAEIAEAEVAEAEMAPPPLFAPPTISSYADALTPPVVAAAEAVAVEAEPFEEVNSSQLETLGASAVHLDTPLETPLAMMGATALAPPPGLPLTPNPASTAWTTPAPTLAPAPPPKPRRVLTKAEKRKRRIRGVGLAGVAAMALAGIGIWYFWPKPLTPAERWAEAQAFYHSENPRQWAKAKKSFNKFAEEFPEDEHVAEVPYFCDMCDVGDSIYSDAYRGKRGEALAKAQEIFKDHRDNPAYEQYSEDLFAALKTLVGHFLAEAAPPASPTARQLALAQERVASARAAHELLQTVGESVEAEAAPTEIQSLEQQIADTEKKIGNEQDRLAIMDELNSVVSSAEPIPDIDGLYAKVTERLASLGALPDSQQKEINELRLKAWQSEKDRVRYVSADESEIPVAAAPAAGASPDIFVVWDDRQGTPPPVKRGQVLTALSRGVLYVFDTQGNLLWARRLGVDSYRLPQSHPPTATSPASLIAVSTEDNTLLSLDATTGRVLWQYKAGGNISSPLTIVTVPGETPNDPTKKRGLLPTSDGNINVLELVLGKQLGHYEIGHPLAAVGGGYDAANHLAYFPADTQRVFAINPKAIDNPDRAREPACKAVLFTEHSSGSLRSEPTVVDRGTPEDGLQAYLMLTEAADLETMKLRIFDISAAALKNPRAEPINSKMELRGWSWFSPLALPDRITLVTDSGDLGVFGLNLDNREESIYRIIQDGPDKSPRLPIRDRFRSLAVDADERYLWIMAGGKLHKLKLDVLEQQVRPLWPTDAEPVAITGVPLHEAQLDERGEYLFLALMSSEGSRYNFLAVDARQGRRVWQRQLGVKLFGDPLLVGDQVLLVDHSGRTVLVDPASDQTLYQPSGDTSLPAGVQRDRIMKVLDDRGQAYLLAPLTDARQVVLASLAPDALPQSQLTWQTVTLPDTLQGRPCICGDFLIAPGADGLLHRVPLVATAKASSNEQPEYWLPGNRKTPGPQTAALYALDANSILIVAAGRDLRRMEFGERDNVSQWRQVGGAFETASPLVGQVLRSGARALATDDTGAVYAFNMEDFGRASGKWNLGGRPVSEPFLRGGHLLAVVEGGKLVAISPEAQSDKPLWSAEGFKGRIRGQPVLKDDVLLVVDDSRKVAGIRLDNGQRAWTARLPALMSPVATAVPFGSDRMLVPLFDGSLSVVSLPQQPTALPMPAAATETAP